MTEPAILLDVRGVSKRFGGYRAVQEVSLALRKGERRALIGPNGAGKTTLFNLISGRLSVDSGEIRYRGEPIQHLAADAISRLGIARTFQITSIYPDLTALANVQVALFARHRHTFRLLRSAASTDVDEAMRHLQDVGLQALAHRVGRSLSYGDQKRLELAIALAMRPQLLLLDEPTAGMEAGARREIVGLIRRLCAEHDLTLLFCEHDFEAVFNIADWITVFHQGAILAEGTPEEVRQNETVRTIYLGAQHGAAA
jgi:branched-chain amino acid transport system ATP-binding protein